MDLEELARKVDAVLAQTKNVLTVEDLSIMTGWSKHHIYRLTSENQISHYKPRGKTIFFNKNEVEDWLLRNRNITKEEMTSEAENFVNEKFAK